MRRDNHVENLLNLVLEEPDSVALGSASVGGANPARGKTGLYSSMKEMPLDSCGTGRVNPIDKKVMKLEAGNGRHLKYRRLGMFLLGLVV